MRLALIILGALAFYLALGFFLSAAVAPVEFYADELRDWLARSIGDSWAAIIAGVLGVVVGISATVVIIGAPFAFLAWYGKRQEHIPEK